MVSATVSAYLCKYACKSRPVRLLFSINNKKDKMRTVIPQHCGDTYFRSITKKTFSVFIVFITMSFHHNCIFGRGPSG